MPRPFRSCANRTGSPDRWTTCERFATRFVGLDREGGDRDTVLVGDFRDPTQLEDLLGRIADCGLVVAQVEEVREP